MLVVVVNGGWVEVVTETSALQKPSEDFRALDLRYSRHCVSGSVVVKVQ